MDIDIQYGRCEVSVISDDVVGGVWSIGRGQVGFRQKDGDFAHLHAVPESTSHLAHLEGEESRVPERVRRKRVHKKCNAQGRSSQVQGRHVKEGIHMAHQARGAKGTGRYSPRRRSGLSFLRMVGLSPTLLQVDLVPQILMVGCHPRLATRRFYLDQRNAAQGRSQII